MTKERERLVTENYNLIYPLVQEFEKKYYDKRLNSHEDLEQVGAVGLIKAANTYDETIECKFSTYAYSCIKNELMGLLHSEKATKRFGLKQDEKKQTGVRTDILPEDAEQLKARNQFDYKAYDPFEQTALRELNERILKMREEGGVRGREIECLLLSINGMSAAEIGERLGIGSSNTVYTHIRRARDRLSRDKDICELGGIAS